MQETGDNVRQMQQNNHKIKNKKTTLRIILYQLLTDILGEEDQWMHPHL